MNKLALHPISSTYATTIDLETGSELSLKDFIAPTSWPTINELVRASLVRREQYYPCEKTADTSTGLQEALSEIRGQIQETTGHAADACFSTITDETRYYLTDTALVLVFPKFTIAPGASGDIEVPIYFGKIRNLLKPQGPLQRLL